jgi:hypothetical protein
MTKATYDLKLAKLNQLLDQALNENNAFMVIQVRNALQMFAFINRETLKDF